MYLLTVESEFSAAHHLVDYPGACKRMHGHNWKVKVAIYSNELDQLGMVIDLLKIQKLLDECLQKFDHRLVNEVPPFDKVNPTSENFARHFYNTIEGKLPDHVGIQSVEIFETDKFSVKYTKDQD